MCKQNKPVAHNNVNFLQIILLNFIHTTVQATIYLAAIFFFIAFELPYPVHINSGMKENNATSITSQIQDGFAYFCRLVENLDSISARIELPVNGMLRINRSTYSLVVSEVSASDVPPEGYSVNFGGDGSESIQLPRSLFNTEVLSTRISASIITASELFAGRNSSEVVVSNIVSLTLNGRNVSNLNEEIVITIARRRSVSLQVYCTYMGHWLYISNAQLYIAGHRHIYILPYSSCIP